MLFFLHSFSFLGFIIQNYIYFAQTSDPQCTLNADERLELVVSWSYTGGADILIEHTASPAAIIFVHSLKKQ